jgi:hypothetical protein
MSASDGRVMAVDPENNGKVIDDIVDISDHRFIKLEYGLFEQIDDAAICRF